MRLELRWNLDAFSGLPHFYEKHGVLETEIEEVLERPAEDRPGSEDSRVAIGATLAGRVLKVIYVPDDDGVGVFVVTAFALRGKPLQAFQHRMRKRGKR